MYKKLAFNIEEKILTIQVGTAKLEGELVIPEDAAGIIVIPETSGSIKYSYRLRYFAHLLRQAGLATILINLLTEEEATLDCRSKHFRYDIRHLASRLVGITDWLMLNPITQHLNIGYFGASENGGAALLAATERPMSVGAVVSRGGRTDLFSPALSYLHTPTLLIVGGDDYPTITMNEDAFNQIPSNNKKLEIIPQATHQFHEPGALEEVARLANQWFKRHLRSPTTDMSHPSQSSTYTSAASLQINHH
ncbi:dienelactone hydrolase [Calothrix sp. NIES-4101]|nr:dienelactone hydrolase [Calothrix sp. NIES-4101]